eukprot:TRINITY_DN4258_c0_g2_i6.p1 TRINITY_DN4258_c0_g2~~TRINITY_DN4258_c0_g2_i6.p1  ORF type:complete len:285 (+),score=76.56 TRINITY_DN4258_c0_g2_i6:196-1050(+)
MGTHPNLPSRVKDSSQTLLDVIKSRPEFYLGTKASQFCSDLPFLFKVLSIQKALSIQVHPNKAYAEELHRTRPDIYKDPNYKPECAIALTEFEALCNIRVHQEIKEMLKEYPVIASLLNPATVKSFEEGDETAQKNSLRELFGQLFDCHDDKIKAAVGELVENLHKKGDLSRREAMALRLQEQYPFDVGIIFSFFLNYITLQPGEALSMDPDEPHAYISGDCIEYMANSDNVIRAGLTPKFKDKETLLKTLTYQMKRPALVQKKVETDIDGCKVVQYGLSLIHI